MHWKIWEDVCTRPFIGVLFIRNNSNVNQKGTINYGYIHAMKYYTTVKRSEE